MSDDYRDILFRKFEPISGEKSEAGEDTLDGVVKRAFTEARRIMDTLEKSAQPYTSEAKVSLEQAAARVEQVASKSSTEAREFLAGFLEDVAKKIKP